MSLGSLLKSVRSFVSPLVQNSKGLVGLNGWNGFRDSAEAAGTLVGNYYLPGSALLTSQLASKGAQNQLNSPIGRIGTIGTGLAGAGVGSGTTGIPSAADAGAGWTNAANGVGGLFGNGSLGTDISSGISNATSSLGKATGLSSLLGGSGASSTAAPWLDPDTGIPAGGFSQASPLLASSAAASPNVSSGLGSALLGGTGGGGSSYGGIGTLAALGGAANSLYANDQAQKDLEKAGKNALNTLNPYLASGASANNRLSELLGTGGDSGANGYGSLTKAFTPSDLMNDPGYQFQLDQGNRALDRQQAAKGGFFSGSALKAAQDYGVGLADSTYRDAFARDQANKQQQYGMFSGQAGAGQNAANSAGNIMTGIGSAQAGANISSANITNQLLSSLLTGSGAKRAINVGGQIIYV